EAEQRVCGIDRVTLEIALHAMLARRRGESVRRKRKVIDADPFEARARQSLPRSLGLAVALYDSRQFFLLDLRLMRLHPGHMGVAEKRDAVGGQLEREVERAQQFGLVLTRQSVNRVDVERAHA